MTDKRVALVTGAGAGIGRAVAQLWAEKGAHVVVSDVDAANGDYTASLIEDAGGTASFIAADVSSDADVKALVRQIVDRHGRLDWACNNAGIVGNRAPLAEYDPTEFARVMAINVTGVFLCLRYQLPVMLAQDSGAIVNIASETSLKAGIANAAYTASKHAVHGLTKSAALEVARTGVRVNAVGPGNIHTGIVDRAPPEIVDRARMMVPSQRFGSPREVAEAVVWVASDEASLVNGHLLMADDGWAIC